MITINSSGSASWIDYNNDGWLDVFIETRDRNNPAVTCKMYKNNGNKTFTEITGHNIKGETSGSIEVGDINNDGYPDLIFNGHRDGNGKMYLFVNEGNGTYRKILNYGIIGLCFGSLDLGDFNNDGYADLLTSGNTQSQPAVINRKTKVYKNNGDETFTEIDYQFEGVDNDENIKGTPSRRGDIDNDGDLDIVQVGNEKIYIYKNNGIGGFKDNFDTIHVDFMDKGSVSLGDYNGDMYLDILVSANRYKLLTSLTKVFINNGDGMFSEVADVNIPSIGAPYTQWLDYDNDGDLDIALSDILYINEASLNKMTPKTPTNLDGKADSNMLTLSWNALQDTITNVAVSYNVRVGTTPGGIDVVAPQSLENGYRQIPTMGNASLDTFLILKNLPAGTYYWSVQAIDFGFMGGAFAAEATIQVDEWEVGMPSITNPEISVYPNPCNDVLTVNLTDFYKLELVDLQGKTIFTSYKNVNDISHIQSGLYLLKIYTHDFEYTERLVIQN